MNKDALEASWNDGKETKAKYGLIDNKAEHFDNATLESRLIFALS
jgi:hypothetical protein